jgi:hypothetical protein
MEYKQNEQLLLATEYVQFTNENIFLTGKAGTGKTTFLHNLRKMTPKRIVVVAPTGVAAINAGGVTIHSFFQLSFAPSIPQQETAGSRPARQEGFQQKFNREKIRLIKCIDLLVIDEISMVRADVLDAVDEVLRRYRNHSKPFGGVQLLMIGDLHQLSPVIRDAEWAILRDHYKSVYFFDSIALKKTDPVTIELKEVFRQSDINFIALLNKVRDNKIDSQTIATLNSRYIPGFNPGDDEGYITLTTHNSSALALNQNKLAGISLESHIFKAETEGEFPPNDYPTAEELELKINAQVMFIKNDLSAEKKYYNGKIGKITRLDEDFVYVKCPSEAEDITAGRVKWENIKYSLNDETREIDEKIVGSFTQIPLKLAWAITIHKSQGLTFDKVIIDANAAFAFGQVYVALSRCRTFGGIVLSTPISGSGIKTDSLVMNYTQNAQQNEPGMASLNESRIRFQKELFYELFDFKSMKSRFDYLLKLLNEHSKILEPALIDGIRAGRNRADDEIFQVAEKFKPQLTNLMNLALIPEENPELQGRTRQAAVYFSDKTGKQVIPFLEKINIESDNKVVKKQLNESLEKLRKEVFIRTACLDCCRSGFDTITYLKVRSAAELDFQPASKQKGKDVPEHSGSLAHPELYAVLKEWRNNVADESDVPAYMVLPHKSILELISKLPVTIKELKNIKGIGPAKVKQFGDGITAMIREYCDENDLKPEQTEIPVAEKKAKINSGKLSFEMFQSGKSVNEIAEERKLSVSTVESHLTPYIGSGDIDIARLVPADKLGRMLNYLHENQGKRIGDMKSELGNQVSYGDLRFVLAHFRQTEQ